MNVFGLLCALQVFLGTIIHPRVVCPVKLYYKILYNPKSTLQIEQDPTINRNFLASSKNNLNNREQPVKGSGGVARPDFSHMVPYAPLPSSSKFYYGVFRLNRKKE